jgi:hypothetical protein
VGYEMTIITASRKAKGRKLQNLIAKMISELLEIPCGKDKDIQGREMGQSGTDVKLYGKALELFPFSIECKNQETWSIPAWIRQAKENEIEETDWLLFCKRNRDVPIVILDAELFFKLYKKILEGENK